MSDRPPRTVLVVDDSQYWTSTIGDGLREEGYVVETLEDGLAAVERLRRSPPDILITDYFLASLDGGKLCQLAKQIPSPRPITTIILTGGADQGHSRTPSAHADAVIAKNSVSIVFGDLRRTLRDLRESLPPPNDAREVIGYHRLAPRVISSKLHGLKQYLDALHEGIGDAVICVDAQLRVYFFSSVALELFDLTERDALAKSFDQVFRVPKEHPVVSRVTEALATGVSQRRPLTVELGETTLRVTVARLDAPDGQPMAVVIARDISDLRAAEQARAKLDAQLHEADKMSSLGMLLAGVSHEINNPLAAMLPNLRVLLERLAPSRRTWTAAEAAEAAEICGETVEAAERIRAIVAEMRLFAHPKSARGESVDIEQLLDAPIKLIANEVKFRARIERVHQPTPNVVVDRTSLSQAFLNVLLNAAQAITGNDPDSNWIRVETKSEAEGVAVRVSNSGPPIAPTVLPRIFEPFFTTKPMGKGVGLGLSLSYDTIRRHGGTIEAQSAAGTPTTFRIWLPFDTGIALGPGAPRNEAIRGPAAHVLIVDDDKLVRNGFRRILERHHEVTVAASGERAVELLAEKKFDVVLCDLIMPGMTGMELYEAVKKTAPAQAARFVFLTGGTNDPEARDFLTRVTNPRAYKPVSADELVALVGRAVAAVPVTLVE